MKQISLKSALARVIFVGSATHILLAEDLDLDAGVHTKNISFKAGD